MSQYISFFHQISEMNPIAFFIVCVALISLVYSIIQLYLIGEFTSHHCQCVRITRGVCVIRARKEKEVEHHV